MPQRDGYIPGVPCWIDTSHPDPERILPFYSALFGWEFENVMPEDSEGEYFIGRIGGGDVAGIGPSSDGAPPIAMWNTYVWVESADETPRAGVRRGRFDRDGTVRRHRLRANGRAQRSRRGGVLCVAGVQPQGRKVVNEHGSLNFNGLHTRDPERAKDFYRAVFGWTELTYPPA